MKTFSEKVKDARLQLGLSQTQLGEAVGISLRAIVSYEKGEKKPRPGTMLNLAKALGVSVKFLSDDTCENPMEDIEKDGYIAEAREKYGSKGIATIKPWVGEHMKWRIDAAEAANLVAIAFSVATLLSEAEETAAIPVVESTTTPDLNTPNCKSWIVLSSPSIVLLVNVSVVEAVMKLAIAVATALSEAIAVSEAEETALTEVWITPDLKLSVSKSVIVLSSASIVLLVNV